MTMYSGRQRKLPSPPASSPKTSPKSAQSQSRIPVLNKTPASREKLSQNVPVTPGIPTALNSTGRKEAHGVQNSNAKALKGAKTKPPLVKARSREFIDAVKKFEGGKLPERILKSVDEENHAREESRIRACETELWQIRRRLEETEDDYKTMRLATERIKFHLSEVHSLKTIMSLPIRR